MTYPVFASGDVLNASDMNAVGMWLITNTTITAAATTNVNNVFSADYPNYRIVLNGTASTGTNQPLSMRLRVSGSDANTGYEYERIFNYSTTVSADRNVIGTDEWFVADTNASAKYFFEMIVMAPFSAAPTKMLCRSGGDNGTTLFANVSIAGYNSNSTSYTGFSLITAGTITGSLQVYGMRST